MTSQDPATEKSDEILEAKTPDERENPASGPHVTWWMLGLIMQLRLGAPLDQPPRCSVLVLERMTAPGNAVL